MIVSIFCNPREPEEIPEIEEDDELDPSLVRELCNWRSQHLEPTGDPTWDAR